ncbi:hypothetical protein N5079_26545 [Planotetraspora sp. A-T 1434]|uniref:hypothetical protein n=1 Tax=Planotetraspora sp. A-T 1434 TaxID=2979219 RepID=UPI0021C05A83|nr:hypothetical protein [Planotetraspora sp. A-T 1434]MCT9933778.1 hypothetical protein [Planotetraspora sp. A-T 1434]
MDIETVRGRVQDLALKFGVQAPDVESGEPPQGCPAALRRTGKGATIVIGPEFTPIPAPVQEASLAWMVGALDRARVPRGLGWQGRLTLVLGGVLIGVASGVFSATMTPLDAYGLFAVLSVAVLARSIRVRTFALDRLVADVCGPETMAVALSHAARNPLKVTGGRRLLQIMSPSATTRAARLRLPAGAATAV